MCSSLILTLQSFLCAHQNMGWIMKYLGFLRNASIDRGDDAEPNADAAGGPVHAKDRRQALLEFTSPKTSVVHRALRDGASLFEDEKKWAAYFSYNLKLWAMALIALAITDARILGNIKNWTLKIFRILSEDPAEQEGTWNEFSRAPWLRAWHKWFRNLFIRQILGTMIKKQIMQECVITLTSPRDPHLAL